MASELEIKRQFDALLDQFSVEIADAFRAGVSEIKDRIVLADVIERLTAGDIDGAVEAMNIEPAAFAVLQNALTRSYITAGIWAARNFPVLPSGGKVVVRFDMRQPRAEAWLAERSSGLITGIVEDQRSAVREKLVQGMATGTNPRTMAVEIVGRVNRVTGKREGGIIGLSNPQNDALENMRTRLASGDPAEMRKVLGMKLRDKRFDGRIVKAIEAGKPVPKADIDKMAQRYADRALKHRGDTIGRTESLAALNASQDEAFRQGLAKTNYTEADVTRKWDAVGDRRTRHTHAVMHGQKVEGLDQPFQSPSGAIMMYPGDESLGAPAAEIVNCRCRLSYKIDPFGMRFR